MAEVLVPIVAIIMVFGPIFYSVKRGFDLREKRLLAGKGGRAELEGLQAERKLLVARIENLESIVTNVDYELNERLTRLATESRLGLRAAVHEDEAKEAKAASDAKPAAPRGEGPEQGITQSLTPRRSGSAGNGPPASQRHPDPRLEFGAGQGVGDRYRIKQLLGRGGMGVVYLATDEVLGEDVALKVISSLLADDPVRAAERFRREASAARRVSSPAVIRIHDLGETKEGLLYLSMEYFAGATLSTRLQGGTRLPLAVASHILDQICVGLAAAHGAGVVHRDLKPANVLVGEGDVVKLIDFGLAKTEFVSGITATGFMMGTPHYMAPEQVRGRAVDVRSDIYALAALAFHALAGRPVFEGETPIAIGFAHLSEPPPSVRDHRPEVSEALDAMILQALAKRPEDRPQSVEEFRRALQ